MLIPVITCINSLFFTETEHLHDLVIHPVKAPQFSLLHKSNHIASLTDLVIHICITDSKLDCIVSIEEVILPTKNLFHRALKIKHIHTITCHTETIVLFHIIKFGFSRIIDICHNIIDCDHIVGAVNLLVRSNHITKHLRFQVRPGDLIQRTA